MKFYDMDGNELNIGDYVRPIEGQMLRIFSRGEIAEYPEEVMFGQQVNDLAAFSLLTADNLALQFKKVGSDNQSESNESESNEYEEILNILTGSMS